MATSDELSSDRLALPNGYEIEGFRIIKVLGRGGFGITYLADQLHLNIRVAIKELFPRDFVTRENGIRVVARTPADEERLAWARQRFIEEAGILKGMSHPNVIRIFRIFERNNTAYMIMDFVRGESLLTWIRTNRRPGEQRLRTILMPLLDGLEYVHQKGFLHRDISPENIILTEGGLPILLDFGSARAASSHRKLTTIVREGYSPIEQYQSFTPQGPSTDLYALAAVMVHCITGQIPPQAIDRSGERSRAKPLTQRAHGKYSKDFLQAIEAGFAVKPEDRPRNVAQWRRMLKPSIEKPLRRAPFPWWVKVAPLMAVLVVACILIFDGHPPPQPDDPSPTPQIENLGSPEAATQAKPFLNSLGMTFAPVIKTKDKAILFCIHQTRLKDYAQLKPLPENKPWNGSNVGIDAKSQIIGDAPVVNVSQMDARDFCKQLSRREGRTYRLPTMAEWDAALVRNEIPWPPAKDGKPLGNYMDQAAKKAFWGKTDLSDTEFITDYNDGFATTAPVMHFPKNGLGLFDMGSNVEEWCGDEENGRVFRKGASWLDSDRNNIPTPQRPRDADPGNAFPMVGFRCVLEVSTKR